MNIADLQDDDYDEYDDYGEIDELTAAPSDPSGGYASAPSYLPEQPEPMSMTSASSYSQPDASGVYSQPAPSTYSPPDQSYAPQSSYSASAGSSNSYSGGSYGGGGGISNMSSMGSALPSASPPAPVSKYGGGDKCPRCNKTVYFAEAKEGPNNIKYHRYSLCGILESIEILAHCLCMYCHVIGVRVLNDFCAYTLRGYLAFLAIPSVVQAMLFLPYLQQGPGQYLCRTPRRGVL